MQGMKHTLLAILFFLSACAMKPPAQEMANARSAIKTAKELPGGGIKADAYLKSAEKSLQEAAEAIRQERYERAHMKALEAKREAQRAAFIKQKQSHH
jgi:hypothetical protein